MDSEQRNSGATHSMNSPSHVFDRYPYVVREKWGQKKVALHGKHNLYNKTPRVLTELKLDRIPLIKINDDKPIFTNHASVLRRFHIREMLGNPNLERMIDQRL